MTLNQFITAAVNDGYTVTQSSSRRDRNGRRQWELVQFDRDCDDRPPRHARLTRNYRNERVLTVISGDKKTADEIDNYAFAGRILRIEGAGFYGTGDRKTYSEQEVK